MFAYDECFLKTYSVRGWDWNVTELIDCASIVVEMQSTSDIYSLTKTVSLSMHHMRTEFPLLSFVQPPRLFRFPTVVPSEASVLKSFGEDVQFESLNLPPPLTSADIALIITGVLILSDSQRRKIKAYITNSDIDRL